MFEVLVYGNPILRKKAQPVEKFDQSLKAFALEMIETMKESDGIGLAAPQVGRTIRMIVVDPSVGEQPPMVMINPEILWSSEETEDYEEGCLSIPDVRISINRPSRITLRARDVDGNEFTIENASGMLARVTQHEIDHLDGIMIVDRASVLQRQLIEGKLKKMARAQGTRSKAA